MGKMDFCIFFITSQCNSNCEFCFYKSGLHKDNDLSMDEVRQISQKMGNFLYLLFSGGEPFLRKDLPEIIDIFVRQNKVKKISIPTNGIETQAIIEVSQEILENKQNSQVKFSLNLSLDALEEMDGRLRGREDAYSAAMQTLKELGALRERFSNLNLSVNSGFSNENSEDLKQLIREIGEFDFVDYHNIEVVRPSTLDGYAGLKVDLGSLKRVHLLAAQTNARKLRRRVQRSKNAFQFIKGIFRLVLWVGQSRFEHNIKEKFLKGKRKLFSCPAGKCVWVIDANGTVRLCELKEGIGNLRDNNYDIHAIQNKEEARQAYAAIVSSRCNCTHACFINEYISLGLRHYNLKIYFLLVYYFLKLSLLRK